MTDADDAEEYELRQQAAYLRRIKRNCQGGPDCGCPWCEPPTHEDDEENEDR